MTKEAARTAASRLGYLLKRAQVDLHAITEPALAALDLDGKQFAVLSVIGGEGPISQQGLSERLRVDRTTMVALVDELERKGLVERHRDPADRRAYALEATPEGRRTLERAELVVSKAESDFLAPLTDEQRDSLRQLLSSLI